MIFAFRENEKNVFVSTLIRPWKPYIFNNYLDFPGEFKAIFETALAHKLFVEKNRGSKI
jgi:hypothetical protein